MGRLDDVINVAGHRLSTGQMEEVISSHVDVAESAVIGIKDEIKGHIPLGLIILKAGSDIDEEDLYNQLKQMLRN
eukprot:CAMPEP_0201281038 /NCGR_PEP_ID=MMETSP1317-20130820/1073_1 /ASSEMBLY_ACC=CAM_ASM_000770 /TAXON_ID=187299 /ORGANISM="Undescribed Undescribed, Strain Undescribed" /LENGTH=74 /DNA_ID=CAMNT_0047589863 /DNA_START=1283 /DNA_END=1507 /DNA_ORIENTATION=-